ncbi:Na+/H+ antiporter NhaA [Chitinophaga pinensis]|uniref:Na(+)/H(+) antiporter NhaA n=1 Tax=Chitinophaga pinensis (strain ATCC 43595 / DSM 2588 / LMG 13176 / NBRC 15968 / NCIMB 11800 / UQM 2034) TaxID=485918 RepID=A0A979G746_CHIPD|nr:Na+/H+ antiporter NhaA [Chitinophaga pinensis]ACU62099.1 Na+/H+ antiporter NhaA [Chitinophaga pinensis DSM 2588]
MAKTPIEKILRPIHRFIHQEFTGGIVLFISVIIAITWANSPWHESYHHLWEKNLAVSFSGMGLDQPLHIWINDGLMALFFFVIGLELKREFIAGELSSIKKASLPMVAALGGMLVPAFIYFLLNASRPSSGGWGIPMATDIAFALALLSLAGKRIPSSVKVFLSALAVADDLGAVIVIALFYTAKIAYFPLIIGVGLLLLLTLGNALGIRSTLFYLLIGICVWGCFLSSGVHATIAGVLVAFTIPARTKIDEDEYVSCLNAYTNQFREAIPLKGSLTTAEQHQTIERIKQLSLDAETPLQKIEYGLHPWVAFVIMPLFALANSGMLINSSFFTALLNPVSLGVAIGLLAGKFIGVFSFTWLMVKLKIADLPQYATWRHILGVSVLAGVGFTMSLFITGLAFSDPEMVDQSKYGILISSIIAGSLGIIILRTTRYKSDN